MYIRTVLILFISLVLCFGCNPNSKQKLNSIDAPKKTIAKVETSIISDAFKYCSKNRLDTQIVMLVNLSSHSGNYRFFVVKFSSKDTLLRGLVTHGHCQQYEGRTANFSNTIGSNCSSEGKYKIGKKYTGTFGTAYKLHGLDSTNCYAFDRFVVLHSHSCVPDQEQEDDICLSEGCPTVSPTFLKKLEPILDEAEKPLLLWVYKD